MKPRVLMTASTYGHIRSFHLPYLRRFQELGWETHVACGGTAGELPWTDRAIDLPFEKSMTSPANLRAASQLRALMVKEGYRLVIAHTSLASFFTRLAAKGLSGRPPIINMMHGYLFDDDSSFTKRTLLLGAEQLTARETDLLLTMNQYDHALAQKHRLGRRVANIPGVGVDFSALDRQTRSPADLRTAYGFSPNDFVLLYAAEFSKRKNQAMLIRALSALPSHVKLLLPGRGALLDDCQELARQLGAADRVVFPGFVSPIAPLYRLADCAVSSSRSEGLPFNIMEAMYASLPVVATRVKGHTDLLTEGISGLLYPYDDATAFAGCIFRLLNDPSLAASLGAAAHTAALPYGRTEVLPQVMEQYLSLTAAAQPAGIP